tara:strand:- start:378 stop:821 length:444 start_codon:yes stop_codon:yes gene_type:complete
LVDKLIIRKGCYKDLQSIILIEKHVFKKEQWSRNMLEEELISSNDRLSWVAVYDKDILGYLMIRYLKNEFNIINMAVTHLFQGKGIGRLLINHMIKGLPLHSSIFLEVKQGNLPATNLYSSIGFKQVGLRTNYYQDGKDAILMYLGN